MLLFILYFYTQCNEYFCNLQYQYNTVLINSTELISCYNNINFKNLYNYNLINFKEEEQYLLQYLNTILLGNISYINYSSCLYYNFNKKINFVLLNVLILVIILVLFMFFIFSLKHVKNFFFRKLKFKKKI